MTHPYEAFEGVAVQAEGLAKTQLLVLGMSHLEALTEGFHPRLLDTLIDRLKAFAPDVIAGENLAPELLAAMEGEGNTHAETVERFAGQRRKLARRAQEVLGRDRLAAKEQAKQLFRQKQATPLSPAQQGSLVLALLASYDLNNAALQWSYLPVDQHGATGVPDDLSRALDDHRVRSNEVASVALRLAGTLGHQTVAYIDDHRDAALFELYGERLEQDLDDEVTRRYMDAFAPLKEARERFVAGLAQGDLWDYLLFVNSPAFMRALVDVETGVYYYLRLPSGVDRVRAAQWEVRNLYMAGNIRYTSALYPGGRVLAIVGFSHKPYLDRYLAQLTDVRLVQLSELDR